MNITSDIVRLQEKYKETEKELIIENIERLFCRSDILSSRRDGTKIRVLTKIAGCSRHTVNAWLNRGRSDVKIPFDTLCKICLHLHVNIEDMLAKKMDIDKLCAADSIALEIFTKLLSVQIYGVDDWDFDLLIQKVYEYGKFNKNSDRRKIINYARKYAIEYMGLDRDYMMEKLKQ